MLFDIEKIRRNRLYALDHMDGHDFLFQKAAERLLDNLKDINRDFQDILILGLRGSQKIAGYFNNKNITVYDVIDGKDEIPQFEEGQFDCIVSLPYLHSVNDVPGFLKAVRSFLKPDGLFLCSLFGGHSLQELRQAVMDAEINRRGGASQQIHPMIDHYQLAALFQKLGFALPVVDYDRVTVHYSDLKTLYTDLRRMGEGNALVQREQPLHDLFDAIDAYYKANFYDNGYVATFDVLHGIGWQPHASQQKPAQRGSGRVSLTDIL